MSDWSTILQEIEQDIEKAGGKLELKEPISRRLIQIENLTKRNVIYYYSAWLSKSPPQKLVTIQDSDMTGFMTSCHGLKKQLGLDLILHTPGGVVSATESIVRYLRNIFGTDIRVIVPHLSMSGGT